MLYGKLLYCHYQRVITNIPLISHDLWIISSKKDTPFLVDDVLQEKYHQISSPDFIVGIFCITNHHEPSGSSTGSTWSIHPSGSCHRVPWEVISPTTRAGKRSLKTSWKIPLFFGTNQLFQRQAMVYLMLFVYVYQTWFRWANSKLWNYQGVSSSQGDPKSGLRCKSCVIQPGKKRQAFVISSHGWYIMLHNACFPGEKLKKVEPHLKVGCSLASYLLFKDMIKVSQGLMNILRKLCLHHVSYSR